MAISDVEGVEFGECMQVGIGILDAPALVPNPVLRFECARWGGLRVGIDEVGDRLLALEGEEYRFGVCTGDQQVSCAVVLLVRSGELMSLDESLPVLLRIAAADHTRL